MKQTNKEVNKVNKIRHYNGKAGPLTFKSTPI